jgi:beta-phosphoglucomutase family hydrolase
VISWDSFDAVLFDLDGVLTPTALIHERAWATMFDELFAALDPPQRPFRNEEYLVHVDGRPRYDGVRSVLRARGIPRPEGEPSDPSGQATVCALGNRKNELFSTVLRRDGIAPYPGTVRVLDLLRELGIPAAVVSSSRNAPEVLAAAGLAERLPTVVDGNVAVRLDLAGKPAPDMFLAAATELGAHPSRTAVVEDAVSGVAAARAGAFALVIGVDRGAGADALREHGADVVVGDLAETLDGPTPGRTRSGRRGGDADEEG